MACTAAEPAAEGRAKGRGGATQPLLLKVLETDAHAVKGRRREA